MTTPKTLPSHPLRFFTLAGLGLAAAMATPRQGLTGASEKLRLAVSSFQAVGEQAMALTAGMGTGAWSLSEAVTSLSKAAGIAKAQAESVLKAVEAAEAAATTATAAVTAAEEGKAAAALAQKAAAARAEKAARVAAQAAAAAAEAARAAEMAEAAARALEVGSMYGFAVLYIS